MSTDEQTSTTVMNEGKRFTGMVKWFNNKAGFGFITVCGDNEYSNKDIFVHYSSIRLTNSQYKYLVQGEYVDFTIMKSQNEKHEYHATDITGVLDKDKNLIDKIKSTSFKGLVSDGTISGGMIPKLETATQAVDAGVGEVSIMDGRVSTV
jgi:cold shock CspA family protein